MKALKAILISDKALHELSLTNRHEAKKIIFDPLIFNLTTDLGWRARKLFATVYF